MANQSQLAHSMARRRDGSASGGHHAKPPGNTDPALGRLGNQACQVGFLKAKFLKFVFQGPENRKNLALS